jgi:hypothetical protein
MYANSVAEIAQGFGFTSVIRGRVGVSSPVETRAATNVPASTALGKKVHGNDLQSDKPTVGYTVTDVNTGAVIRYGETSASPPSKRYTGAWYQRNNATMNVGTEATSKPAAKDWQTYEIRAYIQRNGTLPPLNKGYQ